MASFAGVAGRALTGVAVLALSPVAGLAALAGTAMVAGEPVAFAVAGLAVFAWVFLLGLLLCVPRPRPAWGRRLRAGAVLAVEGMVVWQVSSATLTSTPGSTTQGPGPGSAQGPGAGVPAEVAGQREWRLPTGSRLAYVRVAPKRVTRPEPVVFLHGGPGVGDLAGDAAFFGRLAAAGFQVYVYDQLGAGRSARLADPAGYGLDRDVADLEAIRRAVRAERLNLVARDHGARLAAAYLADHPDRVSRAVLLSPAGLAPGRAADRSVAAAFPLGPGRWPDPRTLAVSTLLQVDPRAAHAFAGDRGLDAHLTLTLRRRPADPCLERPGQAGTPGHGGYVALAGRPVPGSLRSDLARVTAPVLIVKGACDTQSWSAAGEYRRALPEARLAYVGDGATASGHGNAHLGVLRAFLTDGDVPAYEGDGPPPGYRGPA
ncbi:alpha/beta fold hydrolase [Nonomuraea candida]|uniref:alpha/beta fold hydrolase n=1 Tax=Nonomuraea candida TaxID=359159 RepID=UPI0012FBEBE1|nr:alpha/beta fold hydrolase [Nonomuraea candida]